MKIKPLYIYLIVIVLVVIGVIFISQMGGGESEETKTENVTKGSSMPNDDIHKGLKGHEHGGTAPSKDNVDKEAIKKFESLKAEYQKNPGDTLKAFEYAQLLAAGHQPEEAIKILDNILIIDKKRTDVLLLIGSIYYNMQNYDKAEEYTERVLKVDKNFIDAAYNLGAIYAVKGEKEKAKKVWEDIVRKHPNTTASKYAVMGLNNLK